MDYFFSFYSKPPSLKILLDQSNHRSVKCVNNNGNLQGYPTFFPSDSITGKLQIELNNNKGLSHAGIKINLIGLIDNKKDPSSSYKFYDSYQNVCPPSNINNEISQLNFSISLQSNLKLLDSYFGEVISVRYFLLATIFQNDTNKNITQKTEIVVVNPMKRKVFTELENPPLKMEIGIENLIHVKFEIDKTNYYLRDVIIGKIYFLLVKIKIIQMEIQIIKKENIIHNNEFQNESTVLSRFEIMDGSPEDGTLIPFRLFLNGIRSLTPSYDNVDKKFGVQYFLNLEFLDTLGRKFFKKVEIKLFRLINMNRKEDCIFKKEKETQ